MSHFECDTLFEASKALLKKSGLARWGDQAFVFVPMYPGDDDSEFEKYWKKEFHSKFGRYMAWVLFSVGAENLAKAACVCYEITTGPDYGTLGRYTKSGGLLDQLCEKPSNSDCDKTRLTQGYKITQEGEEQRCSWICREQEEGRLPRRRTNICASIQHLGGGHEEEPPLRSLTRSNRHFI